MNKLKDVKIIFTDIDGTLTNNKKEISEETIKAIKNAINKGIIVVLCSGRNNNYVCNMSKKAHASNYIIACNGGEIFDYENNLHINSNKIDIKDIEKIWDYCANNNICCLLNSTNIRYCNNNHYVPDKEKKQINSLEEINDDIFQIVTIGYDYQIMNKLEKIIASINLNITNPSLNYIKKEAMEKHFFFDINNTNTNKGAAITTLLNFLNIKKENAIGFGDHINDYDLFDAVGFKIAMGNANEGLKEKADYITLSNDEHGVAYFLNNYIDYDNEK